MVTLRWGTGVAEKVCGDGEGKLRNQLDCAPDMERWCLLSDGLPEGVRVLRWQSKRQQPTGRRLLRWSSLVCGVCTCLHSQTQFSGALT
jgi:hypothetical protein